MSTHLEADTSPPSRWIQDWSHLVQPGATVLDVACGNGRHLHWFRERNHVVAVLDKSQQAIDNAAPYAEAIQCDLESAPWPLPRRTFSAVVVTNYLWRPLFPAILASIAPGGVLLYETFAEGNAWFGRPRRDEFLLRRGELLQLCADLQIVAFEDGVEESGSNQGGKNDEEVVPKTLALTGQRCVQRIAAIRPATGSPYATEPGALPRLRRITPRR
jgi:SAM-dependent methyltransferase